MGQKRGPEGAREAQQWAGQREQGTEKSANGGMRSGGAFNSRQYQSQVSTQAKGVRYRGSVCSVAFVFVQEEKHLCRHFSTVQEGAAGRRLSLLNSLCKPAARQLGAAKCYQHTPAWVQAGAGCLQLQGSLSSAAGRS